MSLAENDRPRDDEQGHAGDGPEAAAGHRTALDQVEALADPDEADEEEQGGGNEAQWTHGGVLQVESGVGTSRAVARWYGRDPVAGSQALSLRLSARVDTNPRRVASLSGKLAG